jgi:ABC-type glycerol-3-phosphate transport system permease component
MMDSRKFFWLILAMCILSAAATLLQLIAVYFMSLAGAPHVYEHFSAALAAARDLEKIKAACSSLAQWTESERMGRVALLVYAPLIALVTSIVCGALAAWALAKTKKAKVLQ